MDNFVTVITFTYPHEIFVPCSLLDAGGIRYFIRDEHTVNVHPFRSMALGGIRIEVEAADAEQAARILNEGGYQCDAGYEPSRFELWLARILGRFSRKK